MRKSKRLYIIISLFILGAVSSACLPVTPTPALPQTIVIVTLTAGPPPMATVTAGRSDELSCTQDSDCVLAYRTDHCCSCGKIYNLQTVQSTRYLRLVNEPPGYKYQKWRTPRKICPFVMCEPCPMPPFGLVCDNASCRGAETWQEIRQACESLQPDMQSYCLGNAATAAYHAEGDQQAAMVCSSMEGVESWGIPYSESCLLHLARVIMQENPQKAEMFCKSSMTLQQSNCLNETALELGRQDIDAALALCSSIKVISEQDVDQKNYCFHNLAMVAAKTDRTRAQQICELMSRDIEGCKSNTEIIDQ